MTSKSIVLRNSRGRFLKASIKTDGDLVIEGQDIGAEVEAFFGYSEYEWAWTISAKDCDRLLAALGGEPDLLSALGERFSGRTQRTCSRSWSLKVSNSRLGEELATNSLKSNLE